MKRLLLHSLLLLCFWPGLHAEPASSPAAPKPPAPPPTAQRFLFIVSTSASMRRLEHAGRQALFDMIYTGLDGYMQTGDTYGVWTFNDQLTAGTFPMQYWSTNQLLPLASRATLFVKEQPYSGKKPALDRVVTAAQNVLRLVKDLNIFIISDETLHLQGTPFDDLVNDLYSKLADEVRKTGKPIVTSVVARDGVLANATATLAGERIVLPPRPEPAPPAAPVNSQANQSRPKPPGTTYHTETSVPTPNRSQGNPSRTIIITSQQKETKPAERTPAETASPSLPQADPSPKLDQTDHSGTPGLPQPGGPLPEVGASPSALTSARIAPNTTPVPTGPRPVELPRDYSTPVSPNASLDSQVTPTVRPAAARPEPSPGAAGIDSVWAQLDSSPRTVAARESDSAANLTPDQAASETPVVAALATPPAPNGTRAVIWLIVGIGFLTLAVSLAAIFWRLHRNTFQPSVISQAMERR